jgi:hypothetical protein
LALFIYESIAYADIAVMRGMAEASGTVVAINGSESACLFDSQTRQTHEIKRSQFLLCASIEGNHFWERYMKEIFAGVWR